MPAEKEVVSELLPLPKPFNGESKAEFMGRCMVDATMMGTHFDSDERRSACSVLWGRRSAESSDTSEIIEAVRRREKQTSFNYGITTADRYVRTLQECVGVGACYKYAATKNASFDDILRKSANVLTYCNEDTGTDSAIIEYSKAAGSALKQFEGVELPKNTLMVFKHVLTTPRKDRDGDILRTLGARVDPKMLLLWQHVHTLPIGKLLVVQEHNAKTLTVLSCIVDMNELCHDAAVMVDNKMGRFSHGFRALKFTKVKDVEDGGVEGGFDISEFEIMEESLVSVPSNADAETQEILLSLVEGGKLTSPMLKEAGKSIRDKRSLRMPVAFDLKFLIDGKEIKSSEDLTRSGSIQATRDGQKATTGTGCDCGASEKADDNDDEGGSKPTGKPKVIECPECGEEMPKGGVCPECGYGETKKGVKSGRVFSSENYNHLKGCRDDIKTVIDSEHLMSKGGKALCERSLSRLDTMLSNGAVDEVDKATATEQAVAQVIAFATPEQKSRIRKAFDVIEQTAEVDTLADFLFGADLKFNPSQPRDDDGRFAGSGGGSGGASSGGGSRSRKPDHEAELTAFSSEHGGRVSNGLLMITPGKLLSGSFSTQAGPSSMKVRDIRGSKITVRRVMGNKFQVQREDGVTSKADPKEELVISRLGWNDKGAAIGRAKKIGTLGTMRFEDKDYVATDKKGTNIRTGLPVHEYENYDDKGEATGDRIWIHEPTGVVFPE